MATLRPRLALKFPRIPTQATVQETSKCNPETYMYVQVAVNVLLTDWHMET